MVIIRTLESQRRQKKRNIWVKEWLKKRNTLSHMKLLSELKLVAEDYRNYLWMNEDLFITLLEKMSPLIQKQNTLLRHAITAEERVICTLRYLATGRSFEDLKFSTVISPQAMGHTVPETCRVIFNILLADGYIKVNFVYCFGQIKYFNSMFSCHLQKKNGSKLQGVFIHVGTFLMGITKPINS